MRRQAAFLLILLTAGACFAEAPAERSLASRVTLSERNTYLGELLERLSEASGVRLAADERLAPISGYRLTVVLHDQPVRDVMDALVALYTQPPDRWHWLAERERGERVYRLQPSQSPEALAQRIERLAREAMRADYQDKLRLMALPPDQRAAAAKGHPSLESFLRSPQLSEVCLAVVGGLPPERLAGLMAGRESGLTLSLASLSQEHMDWIRSEWAKRPEPRPGARRAILISSTQSPWGQFELSVQIDGVSGYWPVASSTAVSTAMREQGDRLWGAGRVPNVSLPAAGVTPEPQDLVMRGPADDYAERLGRLARLNVLYDHPNQEGHSSLASSRGALSGQLPELMETLGRLFTAKLHGADYLLLRKHEWDTADRSGAVHWGLIRSLRQTAEKNRGYLDPTSWEQLVTLSSKQSRALMREFPDANSFRRYSDLPRLFQLAAMLSNDEQAKLATTEGIAWDDLSAASRRVASRLWPPEQLATLRLYRNWQLGDEQSPPRLRFSVRGEALREVELRQRIDPRTPEPPLPLPPMSLQEILGTK